MPEFITMTHKITQTSWDPQTGLIHTRLQGELSSDDITRWEVSLEQVFSQLPNDSTFVIFVNLLGFKAENLGVHKQYRNIIPLLLARHGWRIGYLDLFPEAEESLVMETQRGIRCVAAAHAHHDTDKIERYRAQCSSATEQFFTDETEALTWLKPFLNT